MAAVILIFEKEKSQRKIKDEFFKIIDEYIESQGFTITDDFPKTYFINKQTPPQLIRGLISTIKNTKNYGIAVDDVYFTSNLLKA